MSFARTLIVVVLALVGAVFAWLHLDPNYRSRFVKNDPVSVGSSLFAFDPIHVGEVEITNSEGIKAHFEFKNNRWMSTQPWQDRATNIAPIITFTLGMVIQEEITKEEAAADSFDLGKKGHRIVIKNKEGTVLADYRLGINSAWKVKQAEKEQLLPTVFVQKSGESQPVYLCSDPQLQTSVLFENQLLGLRDYKLVNRFEIPKLTRITLKQETSTIEMQREVPPIYTKYKQAKQTQWKLKKPLEVRMDKKQVARLVRTLASLTASDIKHPSKVSLPSKSEKTIEIELAFFRQKKPIILTIYTSSKKENHAYATISDRPNAVFMIPCLPTNNNPITYGGLPKTVNDLRAKNMLELNPADISAITLKEPKKLPIRLSKSDRWYAIDPYNNKEMVNSRALEKFVLALKENNIVQFVSDAPTDLKKYGLDKPRLEIFLIDRFRNPQIIKLGKPVEFLDPVHQVKRIAYFATSSGEDSIWLVDSKVRLDMKTDAWEWLPLNVLPVSISTIKQVKIERKNKKTQWIDYDFAMGQMSVREGTKEQAKDNPEITYLIDPNRVHYLLRSMTQLQAQRRLDPNFRDAQRALLNPLLRFTLEIENLYTFELEPRVFSIAASGNPATTQFFYLHDSKSNALFMLNRKSVINLASSLRYPD